MNSRNSIWILLAVMAALAVMILLTEIWAHLARQGLVNGEITVALAIVGTVLIFLVGVTAMFGARRKIGQPLQKMQTEIAATALALERLNQALLNHKTGTSPPLDLLQGTNSAHQLSSLLEKLQGTMTALETIGHQTDSIVACINEIAAQAHQMVQNVQLQGGEPSPTSKELSQLAREVKGLADRWSIPAGSGSLPPQLVQTEVDTIVDEVRAGSSNDWPVDPVPDGKGPRRGNRKSWWPVWLRPR